MSRIFALLLVVVFSANLQATNNQVSRGKLPEGTMMKLNDAVPRQGCTSLIDQGLDLFRIPVANGQRVAKSDRTFFQSPQDAPAAKPAALANKKVDLPGAAEHVCVGGGGRFLLISLPKQRQIAVFDAKEQRIVKYLPVAEDIFFVAAGMEHAYVLLAESRILQRFNFKTFARDWAKPSPLDEAVDGMAMGSASTGPLAIVRKNFDRFNQGPSVAGNVAFFDPETLKPIEPEKPANAKEAQRANFQRGMAASPFFVRASADGRLFTWRESSGGEGHSMGVVEFVNAKPKFNGQYAGAQLYLPAPNSRFIYSTDGVMTDRFKSILQPEQNAVRKVFLPAASGTLFMQLAPPEVKPDPNDPYRGMMNPREVKIVTGTVRFYFSGGLKSFAAMENIEGLEMESYQYGNARSRLMYDMRVHLLPEHGILVTLTEKNDQLVVYPFDLEKLLEATGEKYLFFTSEPPGMATRGTAFTYAPTVKAKAGGATLKLDSGPTGMTLENGALKWNVPADLADTEAAVVLSVTDKDGQERFQAFRMRLTGGTVPEPVEKVPDLVPKTEGPPIRGKAAADNVITPPVTPPLILPKGKDTGKETAPPATPGKR